MIYERTVPPHIFQLVMQMTSQEVSPSVHLFSSDSFRSQTPNHKSQRSNLRNKNQKARKPPLRNKQLRISQPRISRSLRLLLLLVLLPLHHQTPALTSGKTSMATSQTSNLNLITAHSASYNRLASLSHFVFLDSRDFYHLA